MKASKIIIEQIKGNRLKHRAKVVLARCLSIFYHIIVFLNHSKHIEKKYKVSICCIFKNEAKYLKEWIEFHLLIGVEHFYLFNNFSDDDFENILAPYISKDLVTLIDWPVKQGQLPAYKYWHDNLKNETEWVSFLDVDEFICPYYEKNIYDWIKRYKKFPSVAIYWKMFGTSGIIEANPLKLVIEQYNISWDRFHFLGKVLYNTSFEISSFEGNAHHLPTCKVKLFYNNFNIPPINEFKRFIVFRIHNFGLHKLDDFSIQINHYWSKSYGEFLIKQNKGYVYHAEDPNTYDFFMNYELRNKTSDYKIYRYLLELKFAIMNKK